MTANAPAPSRWARRLGILGLAAAALAALGAYGSGWGLWHFLTGFAMVAAALIVAMVAAIGGLIALSRGRSSAVMLAGMLAATALIAVMGTIIYRGSQVPPIHDVTTNLESEIQFGEVPGRPDRFTGLDGGLAEWQRLHRNAYGDIRPVRLPGRREEIMPRIADLVRARGWDIAIADDQRIEATETVSPFRFKDDIIIVATPEADGMATRIDIRSVSRVGISDLGVNARRVRTLIADIEALRD